MIRPLRQLRVSQVVVDLLLRASTVRPRVRMETLDREAYTEAALRALHAMATRLMAEEYEHFRVHAYANDVAPILSAKCVACHQEGGIGPFAMDSYDVVKAMAPMMLESVMSELQTVVARLEEGELSLEESLVAFERGVQLSREGSRRLEDAERRVEALLADGAASPDDLSAP